jgi:hypothetical protein
MTKSLSAIALILTLAGICQAQERGGVSSKVAAPLIMSILSQAKLSGSLEYRGQCSDVHDFPDFPKLRIPRNNGSSPLQSLRNIFAGDPEMQVTQDPDGTIRMVEADVPTDLLNVRVRHISFAPRRAGDLIHYPTWGLQVILAEPEVADFVRSHSIRWQYEPWGLELTLPSSEHISADLDNVTVSQAMDFVLQTFPGLWIYENCPSEKGHRGVFFMFYSNSPVWEHLRTEP